MRDTPVSTYRVQVNFEFPLRNIYSCVEYLNSLGIGALYMSPAQRCRKGSLHGYDVIDHTKLDPELGDEEMARALSRKLRSYRMGWIMDVVPNHMCITSPDNFLWQSVLKEGRTSPYSSYFDVFWDMPIDGYRGKVLQPFLAGSPKDEISNEKLKLIEYQGEVFFDYYEMHYPLKKEGGKPEKDLYQLLEHQHYWLEDWREGCEFLNYRRFFDVCELICLRVEDREVFKHVHQLIKKWWDEGLVDGVRVDHIDGLRNPKEYCKRLKALLGDSYVVVEKILIGKESLRPSWGVEGTTGYDFLNVLNGLFVDWNQFELVKATYNEYVGKQLNIAEQLMRSKKDVIHLSMRSEVRMLTYKLRAIKTLFSYEECAEGITNLLAAFPVYRTYLTAEDSDVQDVNIIEKSIETARHIASVGVSQEFWSWISNLFLEREGPLVIDFVLTFQQMSGAIMAKGIEDTFNYRYVPLCSLNEVGSDPKTTGLSIEGFHSFNLNRARKWPYSMSTTSTHDTKRSEDVRARINVLSEDAAGWRAVLWHWSRYNSMAKNSDWPDRNDEYLLYQTLIGTWSKDYLEKEALLSYCERIENYFIKALREAKRHTSWLEPYSPYEEAAKVFLRRILIEDMIFREMLAGYVERIAPFGFLNSLSQTLIKITAPGIPDFYQGSELWLFTLVDPDNRSHIDYQLRQEMLSKINLKASLEYTEENVHSGLVKLDLIYKGLHCRSRHQRLFEKGDYIPLRVIGKFADHIIAYVRILGSEAVITIACRWLSRLHAGNLPVADAWQDTSIEIPDNIAFSTFTDLLQNREVSISSDGEGKMILAAHLFTKIPLALLECE